MSMLKAEKLTFRYTHIDENGERSALTAINNIDFDIKKGEYIAILGRNGSGKSTLAKLMNALFLPSEGVLYVNGVTTTSREMLWDIRRNVGMVFQNPDNQIVATVVEEDVAFGLENLGVPQSEIRKRVDDALETVGMTEYQNHSPHMLSGGQKQRVAIAGIIAMKPACIVLDEPTAMLDPKGRREVLDTIRMLNKDEGISIVLITHFVEEAIGADVVFVMDDGEITARGIPREIISDYEKMIQAGLDMPFAAEVSKCLRNGGIDIPDGIISIDELVEQICR